MEVTYGGEIVKFAGVSCSTTNTSAGEEQAGPVVASTTAQVAIKKPLDYLSALRFLSAYLKVREIGVLFNVASGSCDH